MRRFFLALPLALFLPAAAIRAQDAIAPLQYQPPTPLHMAVIRYMRTGLSQDTADFSSATADLNGDGIDDGIVIARGLTWCGSGGCTLLVFKGTTSGFRFVSRSTMLETPVRLSTTTVKGWKTLIVRTHEKGDVLLKFDGKQYPLDPSLQKAATESQSNSAKVLLNGR